MIEDLIKRTKKGDKNAFTELIQSIQNDLFRIARTRLDDNDDINDAIQNTMIKVYKNINKLKRDEKFKSWTIKILINECNQIYKTKSKKERLSKKIDKECGMRNENNILNNVNSKMDFELIIENLEYDERLIVTLFYNSGYSTQDISEILNMNINTVKSKLLRVKQKIKKEYERRSYNGK